MRSYSLLVAGLLLFLGCQAPRSNVNYSPLENLPPKTAQRAQEGGLAIWALAAVDGKVDFYLLAPQNAVPDQLRVRMGGDSLDVEKHSEMGRTFFSWTAQLGREGVLTPLFKAPMAVEVHLSDGSKRCLTIPGLGTDSYPILNMCYFDIPWNPWTAGPCP